MKKEKGHFEVRRDDHSRAGGRLTGGTSAEERFSFENRKGRKKRLLRRLVDKKDQKRYTAWGLRWGEPSGEERKSLY